MSGPLFGAAPTHLAWYVPVESARKFSTVLGTVLPKSPKTMRPSGLPSTSMSKYVLCVTFFRSSAALPCGRERERGHSLIGRSPEGHHPTLPTPTRARCGDAGTPTEIEPSARRRLTWRRRRRGRPRGRRRGSWSSWLRVGCLCVREGMKKEFESKGSAAAARLSDRKARAPHGSPD